MVLSKRKEISVGKNVEKREPLYTVGGIVKLVQLLRKTVWRFLKKKRERETELPEEPASPLLYMPEENEIVTLKKYLHSYVYCSVTEAILTITKRWNQPKCPLMDEWIKKTDTDTMHNGLL